MIIMSKDSNVSLRKFIKEDIPLKISWINDKDNNKYLHYDLPLEYEKTLSWFCNKDDSKRLDLTVEFMGKPVGIIGLLNIDTINRKAEYYITIGDKDHKRKGIAYKASTLLLDYAFKDIGLNKVYLNVDSDNIQAIGLYNKLGFEQEGLFRQDLLSNGKLIDRVRFAIFSDKWHLETK